MKPRKRLLMLGVGLVLVFGCRSLRIVSDEPGSGTQPGMAEAGTHVSMTLPRPDPPQSELSLVPKQLPEPGVPALPDSLSVAVPQQDRDVPDGAADLPLPQPDPQPPSTRAAPPYFTDRTRENRLSPRSGAVEEALPALQPPAWSSAVRSAAGSPKTASPPSTAPVAAGPAADSRASVERPEATRAASPARSVPEVYRSTAQSAAPDRAVAVQPGSKEIQSEPILRELMARRGDPIAIDLQGSGWIYTGLGNAAADAEGIVFISRRNSRDRTSFNFKAVQYGSYELTFQDQDNRKAVQRSQVVRLEVLPDQDFDAALQRQQAVQAVPQRKATVGFQPTPGPPIRSAESLFELGEYDLALIEYKRNMRSGDPYLNDRLAECYERTGENLAAVKYYRENLGMEGEYGDRAVAGLVRAGIATGDSRLLMEILPSLFGIESVPIGDELLQIARFQAEDRHYSMAIQALEQYVRRYPDGRSLDEVYYRLARIYEVDSPYRDIESARHYYNLIYEQFPESRFSDPAAERRNYLDRHFFLVQ